MKKTNDIKVEIVEDQSEIAEMYRFKFELEGYKVEIAENGLDGVKVAEKFKPDIILLDLMMPVQDGPKTLEVLKEKGMNIPVVILTNLGKEEASKRIRVDDNIADFLIKADATPKQVVERVKTILEKL